MSNVVIIGNGISGITAARHIRKLSDATITVISSETEHFFSRTALMYIYMGHMKYEHTKPYEDFFWEKNRINLVFDRVEKIDFSAKKLKTAEGKQISYQHLIIAVGSIPNKFGWPGQDLDGVQGLYSYQDLQLLEKNTHPPLSDAKDRKVTTAVIIGGGLIGVELAEMLMTRTIHCIFLVRESRFWGNVLPEEEGQLVSRQIKKHGVDLRFNTELDEILADQAGRVRAVKTMSGEEIECQLVGLTAGVRANIDWLRDTELDSDRGILVDEYLRTNIDDVFAIGDCVQLREPVAGRRPIEQVWYAGRMMGEVVAETIAGEATKYIPGNWFNSAKFFDIEYQTYGRVNAELDENEEVFYWEHEGGEKCLKVVFERSGGVLLGLNVFGIRIRHEQVDKWLTEKTHVDEVMEYFADANFDPEFYRNYEKEILNHYNHTFNKNIRPKKASWKRILSRRNA